MTAQVIRIFDIELDRRIVHEYYTLLAQWYDPEKVLPNVAAICGVPERYVKHVIDRSCTRANKS